MKLPPSRSGTASEQNTPFTPTPIYRTSVASSGMPSNWTKMNVSGVIHFANRGATCPPSKGVSSNSACSAARSSAEICVPTGTPASDSAGTVLPGSMAVVAGAVPSGGELGGAVATAVADDTAAISVMAAKPPRRVFRCMVNLLVRIRSRVGRIWIPADRKSRLQVPVGTGRAASDTSVRVV